MKGFKLSALMILAVSIFVVVVGLSIVEGSERKNNNTTSDEGADKEMIRKLKDSESVRGLMILKDLPSYVGDVCSATPVWEDDVGNHHIEDTCEQACQSINCENPPMGAEACELLCLLEAQNCTQADGGDICGNFGVRVCRGGGVRGVYSVCVPTLP